MSNKAGRDRYQIARIRLAITTAIVNDPKAKTTAIMELTGGTALDVNYCRRQLEIRLKWATAEIAAEYQRSMLTLIPLETRIQVLSQIITESDSDQARLRAIEHVDKVSGLADENLKISNPDGSPILSGIKVVEVGKSS